MIQGSMPVRPQSNLHSEIVSRRGRGSRVFPALLFFAFLAIPSFSRADTIYLKNGRKIVAESTRTEEKSVVFLRGENEISIPLSLVDHIEKSDSPPASRSAATGAAEDLPLPPAPELETGPEGEEGVVKEDAIDEAALLRLDNDVLRNPSVKNRHRLSQGYQEAAVFLTRAGDAEGAIAKYRHALKFAPNDLALTLSLGYLLVTQRHHNEAIELLLPATTRYPRSPDIPMLLGSAYYASENLDRAIAEWNKALAIQDNPRLREAVERAKQERSVAASYEELRTEHFLLRFEGGEARALGQQVLRTLEGAFQELQRDLDFYPRETIVVLLYPQEAFRDIARSPSWVGALNDGKIRVPVSGLSSVTLELARVLKHELTHSFVRQITMGRCPTWFNEGVAQLEEGATTAGMGTQLARAMADGRLPPFATLEASFMDLPPDQVGLAYAKSLAGLEYLRDTFGPGEIPRLLKTMAANPDINSLFQDQLRLSYPAFEQEVATYTVKRYGS
jgi:tetratricopeptide (TPR) repeat protein